MSPLCCTVLLLLCYTYCTLLLRFFVKNHRDKNGGKKGEKPNAPDACSSREAPAHIRTWGLPPPKKRQQKRGRAPKIASRRGSGWVGPVPSLPAHKMVVGFFRRPRLAPLGGREEGRNSISNVRRRKERDFGYRDSTMARSFEEICLFALVGKLDRLLVNCAGNGGDN